MKSYAFAALLALAGVAGSSLPVMAQAFHTPDFAGRDKAFSYMRTRIVEGLRAGANFAGRYTIVRTGCGSGCTSNMIIDRTTGKVSYVPWGGEIHNMLELRFNVRSNQIMAAWFSGDDCLSQAGQWNGSAFEIASSPRGRPRSFCEG